MRARVVSQLFYIQTWGESKIEREHGYCRQQRLVTEHVPFVWNNRLVRLEIKWHLKTKNLSFLFFFSFLNDAPVLSAFAILFVEKFFRFVRMLRAQEHEQNWAIA